MKINVLIAMALVSVSINACADSHGNSDNPSSEDASENISVTQLEYFDTEIGQASGAGTLQAASAFGDISNSAHGTFIKMPAGFVSDTHSHTGAYYSVVISGVAVNTVPGGEETALPVGSYWLQKGGEKHITKCISSNECIFFINQSVKFDNIVDDAE